MLFESLYEAEKGGAAAWDVTFFNSCASGVQSIFETKLAIFEFGFGSSADFDYGYSASELSETLLELLFVELGI